MRKPFSGDFPETQGFGANPQNYAQFGLKGHDGLDFGLSTGTQVLAPHDGTILEAAYDPTGYGNYIKIESAIEGSVLGHLQSFAVTVGQVVKEGQLVGISNNTGNSTGPHLHWGYYRIPRDRGNGYAGFIDQTPYIVATPTPPPPTPQDRRPYWFDLINAVVWNKPHEQLTDKDIQDFVSAYPSELKRSGMWDQLCLKAGLTGDSNQVTVDQLFSTLQTPQPIATVSTSGSQVPNVTSSVPVAIAPSVVPTPSTSTPPSILEKIINYISKYLQ